MRYAIIGHVAIVYIPSPDQKPPRKEIEKILSNPRVKTVIGRIGSFGTKRRVRSVILAGEPKTITLHKELSTYFIIDVARITFSPGNHYERKRMMEIVNDGERVLDMFAAIGNLTMPMAKHRRVSIIGVEICAYTYGFLLKTLRRNRIRNFVPVLGDSRTSSPHSRADRVIMGFFGIDKHHMIAASRALRNEGYIHAHRLARKGMEEEEIEKRLEERSKFIKPKDRSWRVVKSFSPAYNHVVVDILARKII